MTARPTLRTAALTAGYVALAVTDTVLAGRTNRWSRRARYLTKPALMPLLNTAVRDGHGSDATVRRGLTAAQALSWGGDVALLGHSDQAFRAGLGSFGAAHLAYIATFLARRGSFAATGPAGVKAASALWLATAPALVLGARRKDRDLAAPVAAYATVLAAMFATSTTLDPALSASGRRSLQAGTALFLLSDTMLGAQEFLLHGDRPRLEAAVMATYTAAQALIAIGATHL